MKSLLSFARRRWNTDWNFCKTQTHRYYSGFPEKTALVVASKINRSYAVSNLCFRHNIVDSNHDRTAHEIKNVMHLQVRYYAKGRDRPSNKKKSAVRINEEHMAELIDIEAYKKGLEELNENFREEYRKQLNVRGAAGALETLEVEFEGEKYPIQELAQISRKNPQLIVLNLSALPDALKPVLNAIDSCGMNLTPQQEGTTIFVNIPKVTREHRENMARNAKTLLTKYKGLYQTLQNRYIKQCRSNKEGVSEDLVYEVQQQVAHEYINQADELYKVKHKELLQHE